MGPVLLDTAPMRKILATLSTVILVTTLAACGGNNDSKGGGSSTSVPLPQGCPAQATMEISTPTGPVTVAAATRKAVVRKNAISVYLLNKLVNQPSGDFTKWVGASLRVDGDGAIIADGKNADPNAAPVVGTYVTDSKAPLQLTGYSVQRGGQLLTRTPTKPDPSTQLVITSITDTIVCGTITGPQGSATFIADRINA